MRISTIFAILCTVSVTEAFAPSLLNTKQSSSSLHATNEQQSRSQFIQALTGTAAATVFSSFASPILVNADEGTVKLPSGTMYEIIKAGEGPKPTVGELAAIRFRAEVKQTGNKIDDIFDTPEPYYTRVGSGGLLKVRRVRRTEICFYVGASFNFCNNVLDFFFTDYYFFSYFLTLGC